MNEKVLGFDFDKTRCDSSNDKLLLPVKPIKPIKKQVAASQSGEYINDLLFDSHFLTMKFILQ